MTFPLFSFVFIFFVSDIFFRNFFFFFSFNRRKTHSYLTFFISSPKHVWNFYKKIHNNWETKYFFSSFSRWRFLVLINILFIVLGFPRLAVSFFSVHILFSINHIHEDGFPSGFLFFLRYCFSSHCVHTYTHDKMIPS